MNDIPETDLDNQTVSKQENEYIIQRIKKFLANFPTQSSEYQITWILRILAWLIVVVLGGVGAIAKIQMTWL